MCRYISSMVRNVSYNREDLARLCQRHGIAKLSFFGSVLRDDFDPQTSDVDVLIEFEPEAEKGLTYFDLGGIVADLEDLLGRRVDLAIRRSLRVEFRDEILSTAEAQYVAA